MRSFLTRIFAFALVACGISVVAASTHGGGLARRHGISRNPINLDEPHNITKRDQYPNARFTYYIVADGNEVACGGYYQNDDFIVAISHLQYDRGSHCGEKVLLTWGGQTKTATIVDECTGCPFGGLDFTSGLFSALAGSLDAGVIYGEWDFADSAAKPPPTPTKAAPPTTTHEAPKTTSHSSSKPVPSSSSSAQSSSSASSSSSVHSSATSASSVSSSASSSKSASVTSASLSTSASASASPSPVSVGTDNLDQWMLAFSQLTGLIVALDGSS